MRSSTQAIRTNKSAARRITGQGMTEYIIVLAMVALAAVVAVGFFGDTVQSQFATMGQSLTGNATTAAREAGKLAADNAVTEATNPETLGDY